VKLFLILVLHLRQFFYRKKFCEKATEHFLDLFVFLSVIASEKIEKKMDDALALRLENKRAIPY
jgi:hypothetical protein